jgi:hypothetical protein
METTFARTSATAGEIERGRRRSRASEYLGHVLLKQVLPRRELQVASYKLQVAGKELLTLGA